MTRRWRSSPIMIRGSLRGGRSAAERGTWDQLWGGLQDNGTAFVPAHEPSYDAASGDGFNVIVDPANAQRGVGEYTDLTAYKTSDGGHSFTTISPSCVG